MDCSTLPVHRTAVTQPPNLQGHEHIVLCEQVTQKHAQLADSEQKNLTKLCVSHMKTM